MGTQLVWFKRDLRVNDHRPLTEALRHGPTVAFYLFEPVYLTQPETTASHLGFIRDCLMELSDELHRLRIPFIIQRSDIIPALNQFKTDFKFSTCGATKKPVQHGPMSATAQSHGGVKVQVLPGVNTLNLALLAHIRHATAGQSAGEFR